MRYASTAAQAGELDRRVIEGLGLPGIALMEIASRGIAMAIRRRHPEAAGRGVVVVTGGGNNGGDGWAVARWLHGWGFPVEVWPLSDPREGGDAAVMATVCRELGVPERDGPGDAALIVDAVFGTGLDREVTGDYAEALQAICDHDAVVVAVDIPSGMSADTGALLGPCPAAATTVTMGRLKVGMLGAHHDRCGHIEVVDIGLDAGRGEPLRAAELPDDADLAPLWPRRSPSDHKTRSGHLLVIAGSAAMTGAAVLCCRGALAAGAGLVSVLAPRGAAPRLAALPPEVMWLDGGDGDRLQRLPDDLSPFDALAVGPGLGEGRALLEPLGSQLSDLWRGDPRPLVFDADALPHTAAEAAGPRVLTPHPGEAARLLDTSIGEVQHDRCGAAQRLADRGVTLLKGPRTIVAAAGCLPSINTTGAPALATGGSGDVLTGVVGALLARGLSDRDAARVAAWVHGRTGEKLQARRSEGWTASDVADALPEVVATLTTEGALP